VFMYVEDDVLVRWDTVLAWAADDAMLAPLGFQRGFFRTEFSTEKGAHPDSVPVPQKSCFRSGPGTELLCRADSARLQ